MLRSFLDLPYTSNTSNSMTHTIVTLSTVMPGMTIAIATNTPSPPPPPPPRPPPRPPPLLHPPGQAAHEYKSNTCTKEKERELRLVPWHNTLF